MDLSSCPTKDLIQPFRSPQALSHQDQTLLLIPRVLPSALQQAIQVLIMTGPDLILARGTPDSLRSLLTPYFSEQTRPLLEDALALVKRYQAESGLREVRFRLEQVTTDSCRKFHTDHVHLRLLCTYHGLGTEWVPEDLLSTDAMNAAGIPSNISSDMVRRIETGHIALLKGNKWSGHKGRGVVHRSPPVSHLPINDRLRLLLTVDEPTACGMSENNNPTIRQKNSLSSEICC
ncbi:DUF1826 domain-containing protein [Acetobacter indonesiensis]|uniref:DUF1826 domain-containing protein n=1 Tax=Acetobacter indonesiensis TaxID=104101 RepID=UPI0039ED6C51